MHLARLSNSLRVDLFETLGFSNSPSKVSLLGQNSRSPCLVQVGANFSFEGVINSIFCGEIQVINFAKRRLLNRLIQGKSFLVFLLHQHTKNRGKLTKKGGEKVIPFGSLVILIVPCVARIFVFFCCSSMSQFL